MTHYQRLHAAATAAVMLVASSWGCTQRQATESAEKPYAALQAELDSIVEASRGSIGVAVIIGDTDTLAVNDTPDYPMMSTFKLHQAIAASSLLEERGQSPDSTVTICRDSLNANTWSPMLKDITDHSFTITVGQLIDYAMVESDNNASNYLFDHIAGAHATDSIVKAVTGVDGFTILYSEHDMWSDHDLAYSNATSPLAYASIVNLLFTDSLIDTASQRRITDDMRRCVTGMDRLAKPLAGKTGVQLAHKTGSGFVSAEGVVAAVNDGGFVVLPDGRHYSIAVFVRDYPGPQEEAESIIAAISEAAYRHIAPPATDTDGRE